MFFFNLFILDGWCHNYSQDFVVLSVVLTTFKLEGEVEDKQREDGWFLGEVMVINQAHVGYVYEKYM
jgi:hypothetical protein